jgi:hypothetical protein
MTCLKRSRFVKWTVEKRILFVRDGKPGAVRYGPPQGILVDAFSVNA